MSKCLIHPKPKSNCKYCNQSASPSLPVNKIVVPRIFHFEDALGNKHEIGEAKCFIDHRGIIIFYAEKSLPGEKTNMLLKPILEA